MELKIKEHPFIGVTLFIENKMYHDYFTWDSRLAAYEKALKSFDSDIDASYDFFEKDFLLFTGEWIRHDSIRNGRKPALIYYYYIFELLEEYAKARGKRVVIETGYIDSWFVGYLKTKGYSVRFNSKARFLSFLYESYRYARDFKGFFKWMGSGFILKKKPCFNESNDKCLIDIPAISNKHRYGINIDEALHDGVPIYSCVVTGEFYDDKGFKIKYSQLLPVSFKLKVYLKSVVFFFKKFNVEKERLYFIRLRKLKLASIIRSFINYEAHKFLFNKYIFKCALIQSSINNSLKKPLLLAAIDNGVTNVNFFPRPVSPSRVAERLTEKEVFKSNLNPISDFNVLPDLSSISFLLNYGFDTKKVFLNPKKQYLSTVNNFSRKTIVVLFGNKRKVNKALIDLLYSSNQWICEEFNIVIRPHPLLPFDNEERLRLTKLKTDWVDGSGSKAWHGGNSVVITASSTAVVEAALTGSGVVWCPFIEDEALMMWPIMQKLGYVAKSEADLSDFLFSIASDAPFLDFCLHCNKAAVEQFNGYSGDSQFSKFDLGQLLR